MKRLFVIFLIIGWTNVGLTQTDTSSINLDSLLTFFNADNLLGTNEMTMGVEDFEFLKEIMKNDIVNWVTNSDPRMEQLTWKMMLLALTDTAVNIIIETDSGDFIINIVEEFNRRITGGFAGSYPFVESWEFEVTEGQLIEIIKEIKIENPTLQILGDTNLISGKSSYWTGIKFYDVERLEIIDSWTREGQTSPVSTIIALVGYVKISKDQVSQIIDRKLINRDFWKIENDNRIKEFEEKIINRIKSKLE